MPGKMVGLWRETSGKIMVYYGLLVSDGGKNPNLETGESHWIQSWLSRKNKSPES
jgi:hypothetical protein